MTEQELKGIEERWAKATPGPWEVCLGSGNNVATGIHHYPAEGGRPIFITDCLTDYMLSGEVRCEDDHRGNLKAIAAAPTDIANLLAEVKRLQERLQYEETCHVEAQEEVTRLQSENECLRKGVDLDG